MFSPFSDKELLILGTIPTVSGSLDKERATKSSHMIQANIKGDVRLIFFIPPWLQKLQTAVFTKKKKLKVDDAEMWPNFDQIRTRWIPPQKTILKLASKLDSNLCRESSLRVPILV